LVSDRDCNYIVRQLGDADLEHRTSPLKSEPGPPMTLGIAAAAHVRLIVWYRDCRHQVEPDSAEHARR
jgi:hypothetical protein